MWKIKLPNLGNFTYIGNFPYPGKVPHPGFLQGFLHDLILGLLYPGKSPYPVKDSIWKSAYFFESNNN